MASSSDRRRKERERRAASRRLPAVRGHKGRGLQTGGRPRSVRMVGVGQFAEGLARRRAPHRQAHGLRRVGGIVAGIAVGVVIVLWVIARVAGHL